MKGKQFVVKQYDDLVEALLTLLMDRGYIELADFPQTVVIKQEPEFVPAPVTISRLPEATKFKSGANEFLGNGLPIETNFESISRRYFGFVEDKKLWKKELQAAVKDQGHDELLKAFHDWSESQSGNITRKPVSQFLKNAGSYVAVTAKPIVTNPNLEFAEREIGYVSDNKVIFVGEYRFKLAALVKEYGVNHVVNAFKDFYEGVDDRSRPWAARDFLMKAPVMIATIQRRIEEARKQQDKIKQEYEAAKTTVEQIEEEVEL